jgi:hypothetical protein
VAPPSLYVGDEQMHHEIARVLRVIRILQQKTAVAAVQISKSVIRPLDGEARVLIELLAEREISCGYVGLDLNGFGWLMDISWH